MKNRDVLDKAIEVFCEEKYREKRFAFEYHFKVGKQGRHNILLKAIHPNATDWDRCELREDLLKDQIKIIAKGKADPVLYAISGAWDESVAGKAWLETH